ncbi:hypothetical protein LJC51_01235 [Lachnospiraceae bacterium OttesenSCG-928-J05]|nr:hypothetical protein [Lachnospiraceae bacterium OttesenSCG-928-J05]
MGTKKLINNQKELEGKVGLFGTLADHGCGIVGLYNAELLLNGDAMPLERYQEYINRKPLWRTGFLGARGIHPLTLWWFFKRRGYRVKWRFRWGKITPREDTVFLISSYYLRRKRFGGHFQAATFKPGNPLKTTNPSGTYQDFQAFRKETKKLPFMIILEISK